MKSLGIELGSPSYMDPMILSKYYQNVLTYESVKLMKRSVSMNTIMKVLILTHLILMMI